MTLSSTGSPPRWMQEKNTGDTIAGSIYGIVKDLLGRPIVAAELVIPQINCRVISGEDGRFSFGTLEPGTYTIVVTAQDHLPLVIGAYTVGAERATPCMFFLKSSNNLYRLSFPPQLPLSFRMHSDRKTIARKP